MPSRIGDHIPGKLALSVYFYIAAGLALVSAVTAGLGMHAWGLPMTMAVIAGVLLILPAALRTRREFVQVDEVGVSVETKKGVESVTWSELQKVRIITTDEGPWVEDVYYLLEADEKSCAVPHSAALRTQLLEELQARLPGVRDDKVIEAMGSTDNNSFTIWEKPGARAV